MLRRLLFLCGLVVEDIEDLLGNFAFTRLCPSDFEILLPILCPGAPIVINVAIVGRRELSWPAIDIDDIRQAFHERMAQVRAVESGDASPMCGRTQRREEGVRI